VLCDEIDEVLTKNIFTDGPTLTQDPPIMYNGRKSTPLKQALKTGKTTSQKACLMSKLDKYRRPQTSVRKRPSPSKDVTAELREIENLQLNEMSLKREVEIESQLDVFDNNILQ
jgi:hypothetical protein